MPPLLLMLMLFLLLLFLLLLWLSSVDSIGPLRLHV